MVGLGGIVGSWTRLKLGIQFKSLLKKKYWATFIINMLATFHLGLLLGVHSSSHLSPLLFFLTAGFLGSLSTFSGFTIELLEISIQRKWKTFFSYAAISVIGGLIAAYLGYSLKYA